METNKITRQSRSDDSGPQSKQKGHSQPRSNHGNSQHATGQKRGKAADGSNERHKHSSGNVNDATSHSGEARSGVAGGNTGPRGGSSGTNQRRKKEPTSGDGTPQEHTGPYAPNGGAPPGSSGNSGANAGSSEPGTAGDRSGDPTQGSQSTAGGGAQSNGGAFNLGNKSEPNGNSFGGSVIYSGHGSAQQQVGRGGGSRPVKEAYGGGQGEAKKKRKNSDKAQRRASNNRRGAEKEDRQNHGPMFPPAESHGGGSHPRSHSRGTVSQASQGQAGQPAAKDMTPQQHQPHPQSYYDPQNYNPFAQQNSGFPMGMPGMGGMHGAGGFPFGHGGGPFMGGGQQAPQVHFIAKKQQFIAQISPEQLMNGDKRPYTAQSLHNLSANAKRAGSVYANAMAGSSKNGHGSYNLANAAFTSHPTVYLGSGAKTHTQGFSFHPSGPGGGQGLHKYSNSLYGEDVKPKIAGKDILHALGSSNGFSSGYSSDPYHSMMSQGLPASLTHSTRPAKTKATQNRMQAKEKEQLYDETIKMKVLNNQIKEDNVKLKTKVKILENELGRKEKTIEDLFSHNQLIQQSHQKHQSNSNQSLLPLAQTAQKYQQETFLVMSLKKQIRELKYEVLKRDEELEVLRKNIKSTRTKEFEQEIQTYHDECLRLRSIMEEVIKQGASHPIHQQNFMERVNQMQAELNHKDQQIVQLSECLDSHLKMEKAMSGHTATTGATGGGTSLAAVKAQDSQHFDSAPSDIQVASSSSAWTQSHQGRDKSVDKKHGLGQTGPAPTKDYQKELNRARRQLRDKEKELAKLKAENGQIKRESQEKLKNESQVSKDVETTVKTLRDRMKDQKGELKRREDRLAESEQRVKRLEEQMKGQQDVVKAQEDSNKQLKAQLRQARHAKQAKDANPAKDGKPEGRVSKDAKEEALAEAKAEQAPPMAQAPTSARGDPYKPKPPAAEMALITLVAQREKLCRDDLTAMMLAGEESLRMLIRKPSDQLIDFVKANLENEDALLGAIPRFEMPKTDFETQVLREMRVVLRESAEKIAAKTKEECMAWEEFEVLYNGLDNFEYPHKDKLLEFIKYFFLDHILSETEVILNFAAFRDHLLARRPPGASPTEKSRNESALRSRRKSAESGGSYGASPEEAVKRRLLAGGSEEEKFHEEERMLDVAEQCFMRIADLLHLHEKTVKQVFLKYSQPEQFKDGSVLELISPRGFLEGVREVGFDDVTEMEAACLMKVLSKPELDNAVILNEFVLIMENFGIPPFTEEEEFENDYNPDSDDEKKEDAGEGEKKDEDAKEEGKDEDKSNLNELSEKLRKFGESKKAKNPLVIKFDVLDEKAQKILKKLARFLLERYMHPREFFGPTIKKEAFGKRKCKVEVIKLHDFYLRLKLASIRKKLTENATLNLFLAIDEDKHPGFVQVKKMIKALEAIAEGEQEIMLKEQEARAKEEREAAEKEVKDREEKGLPELTVEEIIAEKQKEREEEKEKEDEKKRKDKEEAEAMANGKPPKGATNEIVKLAGKSSPKGAKPEDAPKFNSLKPNVQLNTIEEDLHETQTSHYSYQIKDGEGSERDGSRHQLSTSNHLRDSNNLNIVDDSARGKKGLSHGVSVHSGDYSGGSNSGSKKGQRIQKDIDQKDVTIKGFKEVERTSSEMMNKSERLNPGHDSLRNGSIAELDPKLESDPAETFNHKGSRTDKIKKDKAATQSLLEAAPKPIIGMDDYTDEDDEEQYEDEFQGSQKQKANSIKRSPVKEISQILEIEDKLQDELDEEVDKKFATQMEVSKRQQLLEDDEQYDEDEFQDDADMLKEDTIKTDKIEQIIEDDMKEQYENQQHLQIDQTDQKRVNTMDDEYDQNIDQNHDPNAEEYSYHDEETYSQQPTPKNEIVTKEVPAPESDIDEDYEF